MQSRCAVDDNAGQAGVRAFCSALIRCGLLGSLVLLSLSGREAVADDDVSVAGIEVGFDGNVKVGRWAPIRIHVDGAPEQVVEARVIAADPDGDTVVWPLPTATIGPSGAATVEGVFQIGRMNRGVRIVVNGQTTYIPPSGQGTGEPERSLTADRQSVRYVALIGDCHGFTIAIEGTERDEPLLPDARIFAFDVQRPLPTNSQALDAIDVLVLSPAVILSDEHSRAIEEWVLAGGHLVLALGEGVDEFRESHMAQWLPVDVVESVELVDLLPISDAVPRSAPILFRGGVPGARISASSSDTLIGSLGGPVALRTAFGFGRVTVFGADWTHGALRDWPGMPALAMKLGDLAPTTDRNVAAAAGVQLRPTGVSDLTTQLVSQLDQFSDVDRPSYWSVLGYIMLFLLAAGPLDYWLVHKVLRRPQLTWYTLPAWVAIAALGGIFIAGRANPDRQLANQLDLIDVDLPSGTVRARSWMTVYSPEPRRYALSCDAPAWMPDASPEMSWFGVPETGFRGMYRGGGLDLASRAYAMNSTGIDNVPIDAASTKAFSTVSWLRDADVAGSLITADLQADSRGQLTSASTLTHRFSAPMTDWCLMYRSVAYVPRPGPTVGRQPTIPSGLAWSPKENARPRTIDRFLKNVRNITVENNNNRKGQDTTPDQDEYDPLGRSPVLLARTLSFHEAAGGSSYTALDNEPLRRYDFTDLLELDRAVLFARVDAPATSYEIDGETVRPRQAATFVRIVLPVRPPDEERVGNLTAP